MVMYKIEGGGPKIVHYDRPNFPMKLTRADIFFVHLVEKFCWNIDFNTEGKL